MTRVSPDDVYEILDTDLSEEKVHAFITDAHRIVNNRCAPHTNDEGALASVETYVAAHLATTRDPQFREIEHEGVAVTTTVDSGGNDYWHDAVLIDPTGRLDRPNFSIYTAR